MKKLVQASIFLITLIMSSNSFAVCTSYTYGTGATAVLTNGVIESVDVMRAVVTAGRCYYGIEVNFSSVTKDSTDLLCQKYTLDNAADPSYPFDSIQCLTFQATILKLLMTAKTLNQKVGAKTINQYIIWDTNGYPVSFK